MKRPASAVILVLLGFLFVVLLAPRLAQIQSLKARNESLAGELKKIKTENQKLETELRLLKDDPVYLEKVARAQFNKAKQGEIVYKVVRHQNTGGRPADE